VGVSPRRDRMDFANPMFEQMARHWFDFAGGRHGGLLVDRLRLLMTHDQRSTVVLRSHPDDDQRVHHFWG
jgi:hypothetical protein